MASSINCPCWRCFTVSSREGFEVLDVCRVDTRIHCRKRSHPPKLSRKDSLRPAGCDGNQLALLRARPILRTFDEPSHFFARLANNLLARCQSAPGRTSWPNCFADSAPLRSAPFASTNTRTTAALRYRRSCNSLGPGHSSTNNASTSNTPALTDGSRNVLTAVLPISPCKTRSIDPSTIGCSQVKNCMSSRASACTRLKGGRHAVFG